VRGFFYVLLVIARLDRVILFVATGKDATVKPWHDEKTGLPLLVIARLDRAILFGRPKACHGQAAA
jgi:hypothetical protein